MSKDKKHKSEGGHELHPDLTDVDSLPGHEAEAARSASEAQRRGLVKADGGRYSGLIGSDISARILAVQIKGGKTRIMLGAGKEQGVAFDMPGYIKSERGMLADFYVDEIHENRCWAVTDVTPDSLRDHNQVVVNPTSMPKSTEAQHDMQSRIVGVSIEGGKTKIMIGRGRSHGAAAGMKGYIIGNGGKPLTHFEVAEDHSSHCSAFVNYTIDELKDHHQVMLNPS